MGIKKNIIKQSTYLWLLGLIFLSCNKLGINCAEYAFKGGVSILNARSSYSKNDTVWVRFSGDKTQVSPGQTVPFTVSGVKNFGVAFSFKLKLDSSAVGAIPYSDIVIKNGQISKSADPRSIWEIRVEEKEDQFLILYGIILKKPGIYVLSVGNSANVYSDKGKCAQGGWAIQFDNNNLNTSILNKPFYSSLRTLFVFNVE